MEKKTDPKNAPQTNLLARTPLAGWLWEISEGIPFESIFCPFSGSTAIARLFKEQGKEVTTADVLAVFTHAARALIENDSTIIDPFETGSIIGPNSNIVQHHEGLASVHGLPHEFGAWLDKCHANIQEIDYDYKKALAMTVISRVISLMFSMDERTRNEIAGEEWTSAFHYYVTATNESVFSTDRPCFSYEKDANLLVGEVFTDALYFHLPSNRGVANLTPAERYSELFCRNCFEKELEQILNGLVKEGLGAPSPSGEIYASNLRRFLDSAGHIKHWIIAANSESPLAPDAITAVISSLGKKVRTLSKNMIYSKRISRTEYVFIASD